MKKFTVDKLNKVLPKYLQKWFAEDYDNYVAIVRDFSFKTFEEASSFIKDILSICKKMDHECDLHMMWINEETIVRIECYTRVHDDRRIMSPTEKDIRLAIEIKKVYDEE